ncbi:hypothetical protein B0A49_06462 [Cryomyces minteri]|uniref:Uncharacterized protein n=1 Tax=Cryomyces minteri TaxID=331657 RepID=A0A4U0X1U0_9PEZI|nr:hypothetical protein B0A49_06462 [Cryomyces minteri]
MASLFDMTRNFSLYTIPVAWITCLAPHVYASQLAGKAFDNRQPRTLTAKLDSQQTLDAATKARIVRAEGAQQNGFENLGIFAAAVVAGNVAGLSNETLNYLSGGYVLSRMVYNYVYVVNTSEAMANARTGVFLTGIGIVFTLFIKSGNALRSTLLSK